MMPFCRSAIPKLFIPCAWIRRPRHGCGPQVHVPGADRVPREVAGGDEATRSLRGPGAVVDVHQGTRAQTVGRECPVRALGVAGVRGVVLPRVEALAHVCYGVHSAQRFRALFMTSALPSDVV